MKIIDTHLHVWNLKQFTLPWLEGFQALAQDYLESDYCAELAEVPEYQIEKAVYVEVDVAPEQREREVEFLIDRAGSEDSRIACGIVSANVSAPDFDEKLKKYEGTAVRGIRQVLHMPSTPQGTCLKPEFLEGVKKVGRSGLVFEACMRYPELDDLYTMAKECSETMFIMDHLGNVDATLIGKKNATAEEQAAAEKWLQDIGRIAELPNVYCKVSLNFDGECDASMIAPAVNAALDAFGEDKVVFAANFPVCNRSTGLVPWLKALDEITKDRGEVFRNKLFYENAAKLFQI